MKRTIWLALMTICLSSGCASTSDRIDRIEAKSYDNTYRIQMIERALDSLRHNAGPTWEMR